MREDRSRVSASLLLIALLFLSTPLIVGGHSAKALGATAPPVYFPVYCDAAPTVGVGSFPRAAAFDPSNGDIYVADQGGYNINESNTVSVVSSSTNQLVTNVTVGTGPNAIAYDPMNGNLYVTSYYAETVSVISGSSNAVIATLKTGGDPARVVVDTSNGNVYVGSWTDSQDNVSVISGSTNAIIANVTAGSVEGAIAFDPFNNDIYVTDGGLTMSVISTSTNALVATIPVGLESGAIAVNPANGDVYVADYNYKNVTQFGGTQEEVSTPGVQVVSGSTNKVLTNVTVGLSEDALAFDSTNGDLYVAGSVGHVNDTGVVDVVSGSNNQLTASVTVGNDPGDGGIAVDPSTGNLYVVDYFSDTVSILSGSNDSVIATLPVGMAPQGILFGPSDGDAYVVDSYSTTLSIATPSFTTVASASGTAGTSAPSASPIVKAVTVGPEPTSLAFDSANGDIYVANSQSQGSGATSQGYVSVISGSSNAVVANVTVGSDPEAVLVNPANGDVYVLTENAQAGSAGAVSVVSSSSSSVVGTIPVGSSPDDFVLDSANGNLYVSNEGSGTVSVISSSTDSVVQTVTVGSGPGALAVDSNGDVYVVNVLSNTTSVISGTTNGVIATVPVGEYPEGIAFDSADGDVYVANSYSPASCSEFVTNCSPGTVSVISDSTYEVTANITVGVSPAQVEFDSFNGNVYVANSISGTVSVISKSNSVIANVEVGGGYGGLIAGVNSSDGDVYVLSDSPYAVGPASLQIISGATNNLTVSLSVGLDPSAIAPDATNGDIYVANTGSDSVSYVTPAILAEGVSSFATSSGASPSCTVYASSGPASAETYSTSSTSSETSTQATTTPSSTSSSSSSSTSSSSTASSSSTKSGASSTTLSPWYSVMIVLELIVVSSALVRAKGLRQKA